MHECNFSPYNFVCLAADWLAAGRVSIPLSSRASLILDSKNLLNAVTFLTCSNLTCWLINRPEREERRKNTAEASVTQPFSVAKHKVTVDIATYHKSLLQKWTLVKI